MTKTKHQVLTIFCILLFAFCIFCAFGAGSAFAADGDTAAVTVIEGYGPDSDDSEFGTISGNEIISGTNNSTSWIDDTGKGNLHFQWDYGDALDVILIDRDEVVSYESVIIQEHSDPEMRHDAHWMEFPLSGTYTDDIYIVATCGFDDYIHSEYLTEGTGSVANVFTQTSSGDPSFLSNDMLMYGEDYIIDGSTSLYFKHIPATFRFIITNTHGKALSLESVTLRVVDADGNSVPVASQFCTIYMDELEGYPKLTYSDKTYDSITTNLSGYTLEAGESYLAYALALPLGLIDTGNPDDAAFEGKIIQVTVTTSESECIAFELAANALSKANPGASYNWVGGKSYTMHMGTRCADGCTLDATGNCTVCGYACIHDSVKYADNGDGTHMKTCTVCDNVIDFGDHTGGEATCTEKAACEQCGASYGELNPDNHKSVNIETGLCGCGQQFEARIGDTPYATFADAFAEAKAGDTVVAYTGKSGGMFAIPENAIFDGGEHEFSAMLENRGEIIGGKYTGNITNYGKITDGTYESLRYMIYNTGEIDGGVFDIFVEHHTGKITGGSFLRSVTVYSDIDNGHFAESATIDFAADEMGEYHSVINGGIFDCDILVYGKIIAGTFSGQITNKAEIYGGTFSGEVTNSSMIIDGVFNGEVTNYRGKIYGGEFNAKVTNGVLDENGALAALGHIYGGSFNSGILNNEKSLITNVADDYTFTLGESFVMTNVGGLITCEEHFKASDATCAAQAVCRICGSYGELTDHTWADATCESPKTCSVCKATEGEALGHDYVEATTEAPKTCKNCGATDGEPLPKPAEPAETNWFIRIWNAILDFFRKLFGIEKSK